MRLKLMLSVPSYRRRRRRPKSTPPRPQQTPPAPVRGDDDDWWQGLRTRLSAVVISVFFQVILFLAIVPAVGLLPVCSPAWDGLLRFVVIMPLFIVLYFGTYFVFGGGFCGLPLRVLFANQFMVVFAAIQHPWHMPASWVMLLCSIVFMIYILLLR